LASVAAAGRPLLLVGASGGVFGVAAALTLDAAFRRSAADPALLRTLAMFLGLNLLFSLLPGVSLWGDVGGLVAGGAYAALRRALPSRAVGSVLGLAGVGALAVALGTALVVVLPTLCRIIGASSHNRAPPPAAAAAAAAPAHRGGDRVRSRNRAGRRGVPAPRHRPDR